MDLTGESDYTAETPSISVTWHFQVVVTIFRHYITMLAAFLTGVAGSQIWQQQRRPIMDLVWNQEVLT